MERIYAMIILGAAVNYDRNRRDQKKLVVIYSFIFYRNNLLDIIEIYIYNEEIMQGACLKWSGPRIEGRHRWMRS